jgi:hypothetical protein
MTRSCTVVEASREGMADDDAHEHFALPVASDEDHGCRWQA